MGLETPTNKTPGETIRVTEAPRPAAIGFVVLALTLIELVFVYLVFDAVFVRHANSPTHVTSALQGAPFIGLFDSDQRIISFWLGCAFIDLSVITFLYQRYFMDHVTIAKRRFRKWEDEGVQLHD